MIILDTLLRSDILILIFKITQKLLIYYNFYHMKTFCYYILSKPHIKSNFCIQFTIAVQRVLIQTC